LQAEDLFAEAAYQMLGVVVPLLLLLLEVVLEILKLLLDGFDLADFELSSLLGVTFDLRLHLSDLLINLPEDLLLIRLSRLVLLVEVKREILLN
jgi:hypothetical protein